jgi:hypothetical protein
MTLRPSTACMHLFATITGKLSYFLLFHISRTPSEQRKKNWDSEYPSSFRGDIIPTCNRKLGPAISRKRGCCGHIPTMVLGTWAKELHKGLVTKTLSRGFRRNVRNMFFSKCNFFSLTPFCYILFHDEPLILSPVIFWVPPQKIEPLIATRTRAGLGTKFDFWKTRGASNYHPVHKIASGNPNGSKFNARIQEMPLAVLRTRSRVLDLVQVLSQMLMRWVTASMTTLSRRLNGLAASLIPAELHGGELDTEKEKR